MGLQDTARSRSTRWMIVAALVLVMGAALLRGPSVRFFGGSDASERVATGIGQRRSIHLDDGTRIDLSVATTVSPAPGPGGEQRAVTLSGEAMFTVAADSARPFAVHAGLLRVETVNATFVVRAYPEQPAARVVVRDGRVAVYAAVGRDSITRELGPGALVRIARTGVITHQNVADFETLTAWRNGRIVFAGTPLREALAELRRWQDVELRIADSVVANRRVTGEFTTLQTFTEILDAIALGIGATYTWQGRVVTFRRER